MRQIDGAAIDPMEDRAEILPGKHTLAGEISYRSSWPVKFSTSFEAEAGHTYEVIGSCQNQSDCTGTATWNLVHSAKKPFGPQYW